MRNISSIDITKTPYELGYINEGSIANEIVLNITHELTAPYIELTKQDGSTIVEELSNEYVLPIEYVYNTGTIQIRIMNADFISEYINFNITEELTSKDDIILKLENGNYIIKKISINKYNDLPMDSIINAIYPVGSIYMSINNIEPNILFGGTWERIKDTFLLSAGDFYEAGSTGGEAEHQLTKEEMPKHTHYVCIGSLAGDNTWKGTGHYLTSSAVAYGTNITMHEPWFSTDENTTNNGLTRIEGNDEKHNNMPPYLAVYMWQRTA